MSTADLARLLRFDCALLSCPGGRRRNEDVAVCSDAIDGGYWIVADGLGGHASGDVAARLAAEAADASLRASMRRGDEPAASADGDLRACVAAAVAAAHRAILDGIGVEPSRRSMRSTIVVGASDGRSLAWAHVGDSRLYRFSAGSLQFFTHDHSLSALTRAPQRDERGDDSRNQLLRVLGDLDGAEPELCDALATLQPGDALLLCSDGWWSWVLETEMEIDLAGAASAQDWLARMEDRLLDRAHGEFDNYTAIAVWCES